MAPLLPHTSAHPLTCSSCPPPAPSASPTPTVHAFANLLVVLTALPGVYYTFTDPLNAMDSAVYEEGANWDFFAPASIWPIVLIMSVHIYHMVAFKDLTSSDYFHHRALCVVLWLPVFPLPRCAPLAPHTPPCPIGCHGCSFDVRVVPPCLARCAPPPCLQCLLYLLYLPSPALPSSARAPVCTALHMSALPARYAFKICKC